CGGYKTSNGEIVNEIKGQVINGYTFEQTEAIKRWVTKSLTICFRNIPGITDYLSQFSYARDTHLVYYLMKSGKGYYFNLIFGFYNIHEGGAVSKKSKIQRLLIGYEVFNEFYKIENTDVIRRKRLGYSIRLFKYGHKVISVFRNINSVADAFYAIKLFIKVEVVIMLFLYVICFLVWMRSNYLKHGFNVSTFLLVLYLCSSVCSLIL